MPRVLERRAVRPAVPVPPAVGQCQDEVGVDQSAEHALQALETMRHVRFTNEGKTRRGVSAANPRARQVLKALGISDLRPPVAPPEEPTVM